MKKQLSKTDRLEVMKSIYAMIRMGKSFQHCFSETETLMVCKHEFSPSHYIEYGYQEFGKKLSFFLHVSIPNRLEIAKRAYEMTKVILEKHPDIELFYDENYEKDYNHKVVYDEKTHKVVKTFYVPNPLLPIDEVMGNNKSKYRYTNYKKSEDYDRLYAKL